MWRIAPKHLMTMAADQLLVDLGGHFVFLVFAGLPTTCTSPSDASPTLLFFGGGLSSPAKSTISQSFWATRSAKEMPAPSPTFLFSVGLRSSPAYLAFSDGTCVMPLALPPCDVILVGSLLCSRSESIPAEQEPPPSDIWRLVNGICLRDGRGRVSLPDKNNRYRLPTQNI